MEPENDISADRIDAIEMLTEGRGLAFKLRDLFLDDQIPVSDDKLVLAEDLLEKIHGSFTSSISALDLASESDELKSEECWSGESSKTSETRKASSSKRSRKRSEEGRSWTEEASSLVDDGHAWRKYGQKHILNAKYFRNYFKCTHKDHLGCPAKKHVQQISDDPITHRTVYTFAHTCNNNITLESAGQPDMNLTSSIILDFQSNQHNYDYSNYNNNAYVSSELNQEHMTPTDQAADHLTSVQQQQGSFNNILQDGEDPDWFP